MLFTVLISGIFLSGCTASDEDLSKYEQILSDANVLISSREYTSAMEKLSEGVDLIPSKVEALEKMVNIFLIKNRIDDALAIIDESGVKLNGEDKGYLYILVGNSAYEMRDFENALYAYKLGEDVSNDKRILLGKAKVYLQKGQVEDAKKLLKSNFEGNEYIEGQLLLSYIDGLNDTNESMKYIEDVEPGDEWRNTYAKWKSILESLTEDELFNRAKLGKLYIDVGYPYLAISVLEPRKDEMGEYADGQYLLGKAYNEVGEYQKSVDLLEESSSITDYNTHIYWILARDYYLLNNVEDSFSYYDSAIASLGNKSIPELYTEYLELLLETNQTEKALEIMRIADRSSDEYWVNLKYLKIYSLRGDKEQFSYNLDSIEYESLSEQEKREYLYWQGQSLIDSSEFDELRRILDIFSELDKYDPRYNLLVAKMNFKEGNLEEARVYSKKTIEYDLNRLVTEDAQKLLAQID